MSKLVEGIKDRMVAAAREAAPTVMDAAPVSYTHLTLPTIRLV